MGIALAALALSACAGTRATDGDAPRLRFVQAQAGTADAGHDAPARVHCDGRGRRVYFREQRLDQHGVMRDVVPRDADDARGGDAERCNGCEECTDGDHRR